ncbi:MAG: AarF/ABC1/UbiB kinase family protein [Planctomycetes bacterium]|nr:AarF/ABC1/UbiB kinase family protein [Planctomycetota bacterium]
MPPTSTRLAPFKDLGRAAEIVQTLIGYGFGTVLNKPVLEGVHVEGGEARSEVRDLPRAIRLRKMLEELGPTFIKAGQILSTRADIVPAEYVSALKDLQDKTEALPYETIKTAVEAELGAPLAELFETFDERSLATASIAQVHRATYRDEDGDVVEVAVKVQRPEIRETMEADLSLCYWLARLLEGTIEEVSAYTPTAIVEQFERAVFEELDFINERKNLERARESFSSRPELLVVPRAYPERSSSKVLTMAYLDGRRITEVQNDEDWDRPALLDRLVETAFKQVFEDGWFHGDPHPGNILILGDGRLGMIDHGLWGHISSEQQEILLQWLTAIALKSPSTLARLTLRVGQPPPGFDRLLYERDIRILMDRYVGVELDAVSSASVITDSVEVVRRHRIKLPPDFAVLARATATLEGIVRELYPDLDFQEVIYPYIQKLLFNRFDPSRAGPEAMALILGLQTFVNEVPSQINQLLNDATAGRFQVGVTGEPLRDLAAVGKTLGVRLSLSIVGSSLLLAGVLTMAQAFDGETIWGVPTIPLLALLAGGSCMWGVWLTFLFPKGLQKIRLSRVFFWRSWLRRKSTR